MEGKGFVTADALRAGDEVRLCDGSQTNVERTEEEVLEEPVQVYNFEVAAWHTYYVSGTGVLVHNSCGVNGGTTNKPYTNSRPSYASNQVEQVWENAKDPMTGKVYDPSGVEITWDPTKPRNGQWDMGHIPGEKYSDIHQLYMDDVINKKEFLEWYRNPDNYRPELPGSNRSHKYE